MKKCVNVSENIDLRVVSNSRCDDDDVEEEEVKSILVERVVDKKGLWFAALLAACACWILPMCTTFWALLICRTARRNSTNDFIMLLFAASRVLQCIIKGRQL